MEQNKQEPKNKCQKGLSGTYDLTEIPENSHVPEGKNMAFCQ